jgi:flagellar protein FliS
MSLTNTRTGIEQYKNNDIQGAVESATPHRLIQMLMEGALSKLVTAKAFMERGDTASKGEHISWAMSIIDGLKLSLDKSVGGELVQNLEDLYDYMNRRLLQANLHNKKEYIDEVMGLLTEIKSGWDAISQEMITDHASQKDGKTEITRASGGG